MKQRILCIEDDPTVQTLVAESLPQFWVFKARTLKEAQDLMGEHDFVALIVDIHLPDGDGLRFLNQISSQPELARVPILILSDHTEISNKVMAFSLGAEDFIGKPFDPIELSARLTSKIRRREAESVEARTRRVGSLLIDFDRQKALAVNGTKEADLGLTSIELKILSTLTKRLEQVYSREQLMDQVWGETFISDRTVDSHIAHLRQKISSTDIAIETLKNFGYRAALKK